MLLLLLLSLVLSFGSVINGSIIVSKAVGLEGDFVLSTHTRYFGNNRDLASINSVYRLRADVHNAKKETSYACRPH